jgi:hypothetical protein
MVRSAKKFKFNQVRKIFYYDEFEYEGKKVFDYDNEFKQKGERAEAAFFDVLYTDELIDGTTDKKQ